MKNNEVILTNNEALILYYKISELKKNNEYFNDPLATKFENYVLDRALRIATTPNFILKLSSRNSMYILTRSLFEYLVNLTGVNPLDNEQYDKYIEIIRIFKLTGRFPENEQPTSGRGR